MWHQSVVEDEAGFINSKTTIGLLTISTVWLSALLLGGLECGALLHEPLDVCSARMGSGARATPGMSSLTNRGTRQFLVGARGTPTPPQVCLARVVPGTPEKKNKNEQPGAEDRHRPPNRGPKARTEAPKGGHTDERKGKHGAARPPHKLSTHKHQHPDHTQTPRKREPGQEPLSGEN